MIPSRVRVPDMIKRNIDNLPNPVAARRLIRHQRKCVPVPSMRTTVFIWPNLVVNLALTDGRRSGATHPWMLE